MELFKQYEEERQIKLARMLSDSVQIVKLFDEHFKTRNTNVNSFYVITTIINNLNTPKECLIKLVTSKDDTVFRYKLAGMSELDNEIYELLAKDDSVDVRGNLASNIDVPCEILELLKTDSFNSVKSRATYTLQRLKNRSV